MAFQEKGKRFCWIGKKLYFCNWVSLIRPAPIESPRVGIQQGCLVVAVRYNQLTLFLYPIRQWTLDQASILIINFNYQLPYIYLVIAALFEVGWPLSFKLSSIHPDRFWMWIVLGGISMLLSGVFLYLAQRTIPIATAYIIWTGFGAVMTFLLGILCFGDSASLLRMFFALLILVGAVGLEITSR